MAKKTHTIHESKSKSAERVQAILSQNYEPGRQDRCKSWVYRNMIKPNMGISEKTFWRYLSAKPPKRTDDPNQLKLFDD